MEKTTTVSHHPGLVTRRIAGETLIVPIRSGVGDLSFIYTLNETGTRIWELIAEWKSFAAIVSAFCKEYEVSQEEAEIDIGRFVESLREAGLVNLVPAESV